MKKLIAMVILFSAGGAMIGSGMYILQDMLEHKK